MRIVKKVRVMIIEQTPERIIFKTMPMDIVEE